MASRVKDLMRLIGKRPKTVGDVMPHAATGVTDGPMVGNAKQMRLKKAFARMRRVPRHDYDEGTHSYLLDDKQH